MKRKNSGTFFGVSASNVYHRTDEINLGNLTCGKHSGYSLFVVAQYCSCILVISYIINPSSQEGQNISIPDFFAV